MAQYDMTRTKKNRTSLMSKEWRFLVSAMKSASVWAWVKQRDRRRMLMHRKSNIAKVIVGIQVMSTLFMLIYLSTKISLN